MKKTSLHDGHRDRLREKFIRHGLSSLEPHEVVELMLYAAVPRKDMNPLAHELLEGFGSFPALLDAPIEELMKYKGIGRGSAITSCFPQSAGFISRAKRTRAQPPWKKSLISF